MAAAGRWAPEAVGAAAACGGAGPGAGCSGVSVLAGAAVAGTSGGGAGRRGPTPVTFFCRNLLEGALQAEELEAEGTAFVRRRESRVRLGVFPGRALTVQAGVRGKGRLPQGLAPAWRGGQTPQVVTAGNSRNSLVRLEDGE